MQLFTGHQPSSALPARTLNHQLLWNFLYIGLKIAFCNTGEISQQAFHQNQYVAEGFCFYKHFDDKRKQQETNKKLPTRTWSRDFSGTVQTINVIYYLGFAFIPLKPAGKMPRTSDSTLPFCMRESNSSKTEQEYKNQIHSSATAPALLRLLCKSPTYLTVIFPPVERRSIDVACRG